MKYLSGLLKLIPERHRALVAIVSLLCATNYANHAYHQVGENELIDAFQKVSKIIIESDGCKE